MRKYKWWWDLFCWCHIVIIGNAYVLYGSLFIRKGRMPLSHYEFRHQVVLENLDPENYNRRETVVEKRVMKRKVQKISKQYEKEAAERIKSTPAKGN